MRFQKRGNKIFIKEKKFFMTLPLADIILLKSIRFIILNKCNSKELYSLQVSQNDTKTKSQISFEIFFPNKEIE